MDIRIRGIKGEVGGDERRIGGVCGGRGRGGGGEGWRGQRPRYESGRKQRRGWRWQEEDGRMNMWWRRIRMMSCRRRRQGRRYRRKRRRVSRGRGDGWGGGSREDGEGEGGGKWGVKGGGGGASGGYKQRERRGGGRGSSKGDKGVNEGGIKGGYELVYFLSCPLSYEGYMDDPILQSHYPKKVISSMVMHQILFPRSTIFLDTYPYYH